MTQKLRIVIAGGSGFIGRALSHFLSRRNFEIVILTRGKEESDGPIRLAHWDGKTPGDWASELEGSAAVINLTGRSINCRFTEKNRREILNSRVDSVRALTAAMESSAQPPVWLQACGTGIYGETGSECRAEDGAHGDDFLARVCEQWEGALAAAPTPQTRKVTLRLGVVLGRDDGILAPLQKLTRAFLGGHVGTGRQFISWIHLADLMEIFATAVSQENFTGAFNAVAPNPATNAEFMGELRRALHRPWSPPAPAFAVKCLAPLLGTEPALALTSTCALPQRLLAQNFQFQFPTLRPALAEIYAS